MLDFCEGNSDKLIDCKGRGDDVVSQQSFATDRMTGSAYGPRTSSYAR